MSQLSKGLPVPGGRTENGWLVVAGPFIDDEGYRVTVFRDQGSEFAYG